MRTKISPIIIIFFFSILCPFILICGVALLFRYSFSSFFFFFLLFVVHFVRLQFNKLNSERSLPYYEWMFSSFPWHRSLPIEREREREREREKERGHGIIRLTHWIHSSFSYLFMDCDYNRDCNRVSLCFLVFISIHLLFLFSLYHHL